MSNYSVPPPPQNYSGNNTHTYVNTPQGDKTPLYVNSFPTSPTSPPQQQNQANYYSPTGYPAPGFQQPQNIMGDYYNQGGGMSQPGMPQVSMPQPGMQPGMPQVSMPQPGMQPGMPQPGMQPGMNPGVCPPGPPDSSHIGMIPGYEGLSYDNAVLPPPTVPAWQPDPNDRKPLPDLPTLTEEEVKDAVIQYASENCCYSSKVGRDMNVKDIFMMSAFHYKLETFTEKRESAWRFEPFVGQAIDGPANGPAPAPWDIAVIPNTFFKNGFHKIEVPHTALVKPCHVCVGNGRVRCENCMGNGRKQCTWCKGRGRRTDFDRNEICSSCNGTGWDRCFKCDGTGQVKCKTCDGKANLKGFVELTITWVNHADDYISETSSMPKELVLQVTGQVAYDEENPRVYPLSHISQQAVCNASQELVNNHSKAFVNERILKQRQCLRVIPIGQVRYEWKEKTDEFFVYGYEHKVYFKSYPQKCLCTIL